MRDVEESLTVRVLGSEEEQAIHCLRTLTRIRGVANERKVLSARYRRSVG